MGRRGHSSGAPTKGLRFLLAGFGARGDVVPLFALARALTERGHDVRVAAPPDFEAEARERGVAFSPVGTPVRSLFQGRSLKPHQRLSRAREEIGLHFRALAPLAKDVQLVVGTAGEVAAASVAEASGAGFVHLSLSPQALPSANHPPPYVPWPSLPALLSRVSWGSVGVLLNTLGRSMLNDERRRLGLAGVSDVLGHLLPRRALMAVDPVLGPLPGDLAQTVLQCGAIFDEADTALSADVEAFLSAGAPPVFFGFGSMTDAHVAQTTSTLLSAARARGQRAIFERGWGGLGEGAHGDDVLVLDRVSHAALLPRVASVVHHGAPGMVALAARAGVPQVVIPHLLDQPYWGSRVKALGVGPAPLPKARLEPRRLGQALKVAASPAVIAAARELAPRIVRDGLACAVDRIERLAARPCEALVPAV